MKPFPSPANANFVPIPMRPLAPYHDLPLAQANDLLRQGKYRQALSVYESLQRHAFYEKLVGPNIEICRQLLAHESMRETENLARTEPPSDLTITLTTIKSRIPNIKEVIKSLHCQESPPAEIILNISTEPYLLDEGVHRDDRTIREMQDTFPLLRVAWVENTGPYRKILPFLEDHFSHHAAQSKVFITVDDDTIYPPSFVNDLWRLHSKHDCVVAFRGRKIASNETGILPYAQWSLGDPGVTLENLPTGKDGVIYSTSYFTKDFLDIANARNLAPTADDLWIKWHCTLNGVPALVVNPEACTSDYKSFPVVDYSKEYRGNSLYAAYNSQSATGKNDQAVQALEAHFIRTLGYGAHEIIEMAKVKND